jgi:hypothetical protein
MNRIQYLRIGSAACSILFFGSLTACQTTNGPAQNGPAPAVSESTTGVQNTVSALHVVFAQADRGVSAIWNNGAEHLELQAFVHDGMVDSTIIDHGRALTHLVVPLANASDLADKLGPAALAASREPALIPADQAAQDHLRQMLPIYAKALDELYVKTDALGSSSLRMALPWHEEVLARLVIGDVPNIDGEAACPELNSALHTKLMHAPELTGLLQNAQQRSGSPIASPRCNLGCAWYDVCCLHDQACVYCDHWWCGWSCVPGCFGGECGGGR